MLSLEYINRNEIIKITTSRIANFSARLHRIVVVCFNIILFLTFECIYDEILWHLNNCFLCLA